MLWVAAALLGIVATATVAWSASRLAATSIGLAGAPLSVDFWAGAGQVGNDTYAHQQPRRAEAPCETASPGTPGAALRRRPPASSTASPLPVTPTTATSVARANARAAHSTRPRDDSNGSRSGDSHRGRDD